MIDLNDLLGRLQGVAAKGGGQYMARCPCHNDKKASLAVRIGDTGNIVLHCLAGCEMKDIRDTLGLTAADLAPDEPRAKGQPKTAKPAAASSAPKPPDAPKKRRPLSADMREGGVYVHKVVDPQTKKEVAVRENITREYVYHDAAGKPALKVFRTDQKSFPVAHYFSGGWYYGDGGQTTLLYRLPDVIQAVKKKETVYLVEGEKDADTLTAMGLCGTTNKGGAGKWGDAATQALTGARVAIIPDIDEPGLKHGRLIAKALQNRADEVRIIDLRSAGTDLLDKGDITDLAERLGTEGAKARLLRLKQDAPIIFRRVDDSAYRDYFDFVPGCRVEHGCIVAPYKDSYLPLCNFVALPIEETHLDDGQAQSIRLRIAGWDGTGRRLKDALVMAEEFGGMGWVLKNWALSACIEPGSTAKDRLRAIIQKAGAKNAVRRTVYTHTGWREVGGRPVYLHGGGAIGAEGVGVELGYGFNDKYDLSGLADGMLPDMEMLARRQYAMTYTFKTITVAGVSAGAPMAGFMFLSPLRHFLDLGGCPPAFIPYLCGKTGNGKSLFAALMLCHFGRRFNNQNMPASFEDTGNGISLKLNALKDMPLLIDDYHPEGDARKKKAMDAVAQQVSRMIGDGTVRSRMNADASSKEDRPARGTAFETGEQLPDVTYSGLARLYVIELGEKDVPIGSEMLNDLIARAREGVLSETMRGYVEWLIPQYGQLADQLAERYAELRALAVKMAGANHNRLPSAAAHLMLGLEMMLKYAVHLEVLAQGDADELAGEWFEAIVDNSRKQDNEMGGEKPTKIYLDTLRELIVSNRYVVMDMAGRDWDIPANCIGYKDASYYYLIPGQAYGAVQRSCQEQNTQFPIGKNAVAKMLREENLLMPSTDGAKNVRQLMRGAVKGWFQWIPRHVIDNVPPPAPPPQQVGFVEVVDDDNPFAKGGPK